MVDPHAPIVMLPRLNRGARVPVPIYEYACKACQHEFENIQKVSEAPLVECPQCGEPQLRKKISAVAFRLKGRGWYETDFKSGAKKNLHGEQPKSEGSGDSTDTTKSESKSSDANGPAESKAGSKAGSKAASSNGNSGGAKASETKS